MNFEKIKSEIESKKEVTDYLLKQEKKGEFYPAYDCNLKDFNSSFKGVLPENGITGYLDQSYNDRKGELVGIELGGPGCKLFADMEGYFIRTAGVTLYHRPGLVPPSGHQVIEADAFSKRRQTKEEELQGYQAIEDWVRENGKADLLISRMGDGYLGLSEDVFIMDMERWYKLLNDQGTILLDLPGFEEKFTYTFAQYLKKFLLKYKEYFDFSIIDKDGGYSAVRIKKLANAPDSIDDLVNQFISNNFR